MSCDGSAAMVQQNLFALAAYEHTDDAAHGNPSHRAPAAAPSPRLKLMIQASQGCVHTAPRRAPLPVPIARPQSASLSRSAASHINLPDVVVRDDDSVLALREDKRVC
jgi:hypothetical protein